MSDGTQNTQPTPAGSQVTVSLAEIAALVGDAIRPGPDGRPGWKTTEFWLTAAAVAGQWGAAYFGAIDGEWAAVVSSLCVAAYCGARAYTKRRGG